MTDKERLDWLEKNRAALHSTDYDRLWVVMGRMAQAEPRLCERQLTYQSV